VRKPDWHEVQSGGVFMIGGVVMMATGLAGFCVGAWHVATGLLGYNGKKSFASKYR
jgi:hypothetical protein